MRVLLLVLLLQGIAHADTVLYYRDSDGKVVGSTTSQGQVNADLELKDYGEGYSYKRLDARPETSPGHDLYVQSGNVSEVETQAHKDSQQELDSIKQKLEGLGFTKAEVNRLL